MRITLAGDSDRLLVRFGDPGGGTGTGISLRSEYLRLFRAYRLRGCDAASWSDITSSLGSGRSCSTGRQQRNPHLGPSANPCRQRRTMTPVAGSSKLTGSRATTATSPRRAGGARHPRSQPSFVQHLLHRSPPTLPAWAVVAASRSSASPRRGVQPAEPALPRQQAGEPDDLGGQRQRHRHVDLPVVGGDEQHGTGRQRRRPCPPPGGPWPAARRRSGGPGRTRAPPCRSRRSRRRRTPPRRSAPTSTARLDGSRHPTWRTPARWASVKPLPTNSDLATTGTELPRNGRRGCTSSGTMRRASPAGVLQRRTFSTSPCIAIRYPLPRALRGQTGGDAGQRGRGRGRDRVDGPAGHAGQRAASAERSRSWSHPRPSSTNSTTWRARAPAPGTSPAGRPCRPGRGWPGRGW